MSHYYPDIDIPFDEPINPSGPTELEDAIIEDTAHCDFCGVGCVLGGGSDLVVVNLPKQHGHPEMTKIGGQLKLCADCAMFVSLALKQNLQEKDICEHGVCCGDWCEPCNRAYKQALIDNGYVE